MQSDEGETRAVRACPECDSSQLHRNVPGSFGSAGDGGDSAWHCRHCGARFDDPVRRDPHNGGESRTGLAGRLANPDVTDVDDLATDGGRDVQSLNGTERGGFDESVAECPFCEFGNLKVNWAGINGEEKVLRCSYVDCGALIKSYQDEWPDHVPRSVYTGTDPVAESNGDVTDE